MVCFVRLLSSFKQNDRVKVTVNLQIYSWCSSIFLQSAIRAQLKHDVAQTRRTFRKSWFCLSNKQQPEIKQKYVMPIVNVSHFIQFLLTVLPTSIKGWTRFESKWCDLWNFERMYFQGCFKSIMDVGSPLWNWIKKIRVAFHFGAIHCSYSIPSCVSKMYRFHKHASLDSGTPAAFWHGDAWGCATIDTYLLVHKKICISGSRFAQSWDLS